MSPLRLVTLVALISACFPASRAEAARDLLSPPLVFSGFLSPDNSVAAPWKAPIDSPYASWKHYSRSYFVNLTNISTVDAQQVTIRIILSRAGFKCISGSNTWVNQMSRLSFRKLNPIDPFDVSGIYARSPGISIPATQTYVVNLSPLQSTTVASAVDFLGPLTGCPTGTPNTVLDAEIKVEISVLENRGGVVGNTEVRANGYSQAVQDTIASVPALSGMVLPLNGGRAF
jgi:hypothetical protein